MSSKIFIDNFSAGLELKNEAFFVDEKNLKSDRNGEPFLDVNLRDRTGLINSKIWKDNAERFDLLFDRGDFISVHGLVEKNTYQGKTQLQLKIHSLSRLDLDNIDVTEFVESFPSEHIEAFYNKILRVIDEISDPFIQELLNSFYRDPELSASIRNCPAAKSMHHAKLGGLIKHVSYMLVLAKAIARPYRLNSDLLNCGILLHDIGKLRELEAKFSIEYTTEGELLGHITAGATMIREHAGRIPEFPKELLMLIEHMVLSHHGIPEYGAVKYPQFREAVILHYIDNIDAKMDMMTNALGKINGEGIWTEKIWGLHGDKSTRILDPARFYLQSIPPESGDAQN